MNIRIAYNNKRVIWTQNLNHHMVSSLLPQINAMSIELTDKNKGHQFRFSYYKSLCNKTKKNVFSSFSFSNFYLSL